MWNTITITYESNPTDWKWLDSMPIDNLKDVGVIYEITYHMGLFQKDKVEYHIVDIDKFMIEKMKRCGTQKQP